MNLILKKFSSRNELSQEPFFLLGERSEPCSIEISRDIYMYVCMYVGISSIVYGNTIQKNRMQKCVDGIT